MHDTPAMRVKQAFEGLKDNHDPDCKGYGPRLPQEVLKIPSVNIFPGNVKRPVIFAEIEHTRDIVMVQGHGRPGFIRQTLYQAVVRGHSGVELLNDDLAFRGLVYRAVHGPHVAVAYFFDSGKIFKRKSHD